MIYHRISVYEILSYFQDNKRNSEYMFYNGSSQEIKLSLFHILFSNDINALILQQYLKH